jgi:CheY-like chemotaxis protein
MNPVLVIEDEIDAQEIVTGLLLHVDIDVRVAGSAEEAWNIVKSHPLTAVIIDLNLPGMDGLSFLRSLRAEPSTVNLPCMIVTAYSSSVVKKEALEAGCNAYLIKPLDHHHFLQVLTRLLK